MLSFLSERQNRLSATEGTLTLLSETNSLLKTEEKKAKEELSVVEKKLGPLRAKSQQLQSQANSLYMNVARLTNTDMKPPDMFGESAVPVENEPGPRTQCVVCEGSHDNHLMVLCDTCDNHYHISCVDPPLTKVPKKSHRWGWYVHTHTHTPIHSSHCIHDVQVLLYVL